MLLSVLILGQIATASPVPTQVPTPPLALRPAPALSGGPAAAVSRPSGKPVKVLSVQDGKPQPTPEGRSYTFDEKKATSAASPAQGGVEKLTTDRAEAAAAAQDRMNRAAAAGLRAMDVTVYGPLTYGLRMEARREWDWAAEACRKTDGCRPIYRPKNALETSEETITRIQDKSL